MFSETEQNKMTKETSAQILRNFLNLYWARPEVAIWRTLDVFHMKNIEFKNPILDIGCGDGSFTFTHFGGKCAADYDVYKTIKSTRGFWKGQDIHNHYNKLEIKITKRPSKIIDCGMDWKQSLLDKAKKYGAYKELIQQDLNKPIKVDDEAFNSIFSNVFYWIKNLESLINESFRILKKNGILVVCVPNENFKKNLIYNLYLKNKYYWAKELDRGIYQHTSQHCYTKNKWSELFTRSGFSILETKDYLSERLIKFWTVGSRPLSPYLIEMANKTQTADRKKIKQKMIKELFPIIRSYLEFEINDKSKKCFNLFVLKK